MKSFVRAIACAMLCSPAVALAADSGGSSTSSWSAAGKSESAELKAAKAALAAGDYAAAQAQLKAALATDASNADLHNLYAYAIRKGANPDMPLVFEHYEEALRLDPKHRGAHEYIGEAYLMVGNPAKAKEHLAALDRLCLFSCEEYDKLSKALVAYEATMPKQAPK